MPFVATSRIVRQVLAACIALLFLLAAASPSVAQKDKKKKKDDAPAGNSAPLVPMSDEQQIDYNISSMLGAWQLGDVDRMHQYYADDVTVVNGLWAPPVIGWANYVPLYQQQHARMQRVRMDRTNTYIKVSGTVAWACYQWEFNGAVDGNNAAAQGQTTLVMEKRNGKWLIVHDHTSISPQSSAPVATPAHPATP